MPVHIRCDETRFKEAKLGLGAVDAHHGTLDPATTGMIHEWGDSEFVYDVSKIKTQDNSLLLRGPYFYINLQNARYVTTTDNVDMSNMKNVVPQGATVLYDVGQMKFLNRPLDIAFDRALVTITTHEVVNGTDIHNDVEYNDLHEYEYEGQTHTRNEQVVCYLEHTNGRIRVTPDSHGVDSTFTNGSMIGEVTASPHQSAILHHTESDGHIYSSVAEPTNSEYQRIKARNELQTAPDNDVYEYGINEAHKPINKAIEEIEKLKTAYTREEQNSIVDETARQMKIALWQLYHNTNLPEHTQGERNQLEGLLRGTESLKKNLTDATESEINVIVKHWKNSISWPARNFEQKVEALEKDQPIATKIRSVWLEEVDSTYGPDVTAEDRVDIAMAYTTMATGDTEISLRMRMDGDVSIDSSQRLSNLNSRDLAILAHQLRSPLNQGILARLRNDYDPKDADSPYQDAYEDPNKLDPIPEEDEGQETDNES